MKLISIGNFAKATGLSTQTLRRWDDNGQLPSIKKLEGNGKRFYSEDQLNQYLSLNKDTTKRKVIGYCRVSSNKQKDDLERQISNVNTYMIAKGYSFETITDIGSGINYNKKGLNKLIDLIITNQVEKIVVLYKDRLLRFGFELIENLCSKFDVEIEIIDNTEKTEEQELVEDLVQIVTVFSCRLQGKRANKAKKMIKEMMDNEDS